ncbi:hypothetical protein PCANC_26191 [Puccinia coronata f. sp. avenae]|uniref:Uncharacterized protein n=1 Tax=Puccinia coronata f. sp. avenae TaxID=200324 RepID=A0A2N5RZC5_9BASI|nr:hypothetical protein PCANC_26191 [Puccinia coronata f. sp. avenae]
MQLSLHLIVCTVSLMIVSSAGMPTSTSHAGVQQALKSIARPYGTHQMFLTKMKTTGIRQRIAKRGKSGKGMKSNKRVKRGKGLKAATPAKSGKQMIANRAHLAHIFKGQYRNLLFKPTPEVVEPTVAALRRSLLRRLFNKRTPIESPLATLLGTASSTAGSLPVVGVPLTSLLSTLPTGSLASPGAVTGLLGTLTDAAQSAPVLGDLLKMLPLSSILKGNPLDNVKNTLSGLFVAIPVLGGPLSGIANTASSLASTLPISLFRMGPASPAGSQRTVTEPESNEYSSQSGSASTLLSRSLRSGRLIAAREH